MRGISSSLSFVLVACVVAGSPTGVLAQEAEPADELVVTKDLYYGGGGVLDTVDVYAPSEAGPWPVVVNVHGAYAHKSNYEELVEAIAGEGAVVFNVQVSMTPPFRDATREVACAVRFARATAADHGGDPGHITLVGHSAGAATGMVVAMAGDEFAQDCVVAEGSALVDRLVGYEGPYDWTLVDYDEVNLVPLRDEEPELWRALDPYVHFGDNPDLVVRLVHGVDADAEWYEVPSAVSVELEEALLEAGCDTQLTLLEGEDHDAVIRTGTDAFDVVVQQALTSVK